MEQDLQGLPREYEVGVAHCGSHGKSDIDLKPTSVVFLEPNLMASTNEAKRFAKDVLSQSSPLVYAISTKTPLTGKGTKAAATNLIESLSNETGGKPFSPAENKGRNALEDIGGRLHARYVIAWTLHRRMGVGTI